MDCRKNILTHFIHKPGSELLKLIYYQDYASLSNLDNSVVKVANSVSMLNQIP